MDRLNRRTFLKQTSLGSALAFVPVPFFTSCQTENQTSLHTGSLFEAFQVPSSESKPFFRWWWNGNYVKKDELLREIQVIKEAGAGGVEINPIALHETIETPESEPVSWLSDQWINLINEIVKYGTDNDIIVDLIVGTGWPFGAEFIKPENTIQGIEIIKKEIEGPSVFRNDITLDNNQKIYQVSLVPDNVRDVEEIRTFSFGAGEEVRIDVPEGKFQLFILVWRNQFREVMFGASGGAGPVLDHFQKSVVKAYLNRMTDRLKEKMDMDFSKIRGMFCDSIELEGANWTDNFEEEFKKRRGYDIKNYLPLVLNFEGSIPESVQETVYSARYDYCKTLSELFMENFIQVFHQWCQENNLKSRYQAYGYPWLYTDMIDGYMVPDIPEGDQWLFNAGWVPHAEIDEIRYAIWNKYASSGGHLANRRIISSEAMTNTREVFRASLEYIKQATDINIATGINHLVLHGFNYSPPSEGLPGWIRFGTYFNENNPWWPYFKYWSAYASRLSQLFQLSQPVSQVAVLGPTPDIWRQYGLDRNPFNTTPWYLHSLWQALSHSGYTSDYINEKILQNGEIEDGGLQYGPMNYQVILVCSAQSINVGTAEALKQYADKGVRIAFVEQVPRQTPGLSADDSDKKVRSIIEEILKNEANVWQFGEPELENETNWWYEVMQQMKIKPSVKISDPDKRLFINHSMFDSMPVYFLVNSNTDKELRLKAEFSHKNLYPWQWDAQNGTKVPLNYTGQKLDIKLEPLESLLVVFENNKGEPVESPTFDPSESHDIEGKWSVSFNPVEGRSFSRKLDRLTDLTRIEELKYFSGTIEYSIEFSLPDPSPWKVFSLGDVFHTSEVELNGQSLGVRWWGKHEYPIEKGILRQTSNQLKITVTNLLFNHIAGMEKTPHIEYWLDRSREKELPPSGLAGPVRVIG